MRYRGRGFVIGASLSAFVLVASGCSSSADAEPTPSFASSTADAGPSPEPTEPPYETELNLTSDEKNAADAAYDLLVRFRQADSQVAVDPGRNPEDSLQYLDGGMLEDYKEGYEEMAEAGERGVGAIRHRYYHLTDVSLQTETDDERSVEFESCQDYSEFDIVDKSGKSLKGEGVVASPVIYRLTATDEEWKVVDSEYVDGECD